MCEVIPTGPRLRAALQAVYTTPDSIDFVDYWYRERLECGSDSPTAGVAFRVDGRRWSCFRDELTYRKVPALKRRPLRVRQYVFEAAGARLVVLACRQPDEPVTQIAVTVLAGIGALAAYLINMSDLGGQALDWLGQQFQALKSTAIRTFGGIGDALAAGALSLAARIL
uniref:Uncharacterized protein n=1 Tax=Schlesneria paludicola TaxID=360056 RepID=A0A7C4QS40_9PLAN